MIELVPPRRTPRDKSVPADLAALARAEGAVRILIEDLETICADLDWHETRRVKAFLDQKYSSVGRLVPVKEVD